MWELDEFFKELNAALVEEAYEWVIEACRKKIKKFGDEPTFIFYLSLAGIRSGRLGMTVNKLLPVLETSTGAWHLAFLGLLAHCVKGIKENQEQWPQYKTTELEAWLKEVSDLVEAHRSELFEMLPGFIVKFTLFELKYNRKETTSSESSKTIYIEEEFLLSFLEFRPFPSPLGMKSRDPRFLEVIHKIEAGLYREAYSIISEMNLPRYLKTAFLSEVEGSEEKLSKACALTKKAIREGWKGPVPKCRLALFLFGMGKEKEAARIAATLPSNSSSAMYAKACLLMPQRKYSKVVELLESIPKNAPFFRRRDVLLVQSYLEVGKYEKAEAYLKDLLESNNWGIGVALAQYFCNIRKFKQCLFICEELLNWRGEETLFFLKAVSLYMMNRKEEALLCCQKVLNTSDSEKLEWVISAFSGRHEILLPYTERLLTLDPMHSRARKLKTQILMSKRKYAEAEECLKPLKNKHALFIRAQCMEKLEKHKKALLLYEEAGRAASYRVKAKKAVARCLKALEREESISKLREEGEQLLKAREWKSLRSTAKVLLQTFPEDSQVIWWMAKSCAEQSRNESAKKWYQKLPWNKIRDEEVLADLIAKAEWLNLPVDKITQKLGEVSPNHPRICFQKAMRCCAKGRVDEALTYFNGAASDPEIAGRKDFILGHSWALQKNKDYDKALHRYQKLGGKETFVRKLHCLWEMGDKEECQKQLMHFFQEEDFDRLKQDWDNCSKNLNIPIRNEETSAFLRYSQGIYAKYLADNGQIMDAAETYILLSKEEDLREAITSFTKQHEDVLPIYIKGQLTKAGKEIIMLDTNVLIFKILGELNNEELPQYPQYRVAVQQFARLLSADTLFYLPSHVLQETAHVINKIIAGLHENMENKNQLRKQAADKIQVLQKLSPPLLLRAVGEMKPETLHKVKQFYRQHEQVLKEITERKCSSLNQEEIKRKLAEREQEFFPEYNDLLTLAQASHLASSPLEGIYQISLISDDADFHTFQREIEESFGVRIHPLIGPIGDGWWELLHRQIG